MIEVRLGDLLLWEGALRTETSLPKGCLHSGSSLIQGSPFPYCQAHGLSRGYSSSHCLLKDEHGSNKEQAEGGR